MSEPAEPGPVYESAFNGVPGNYLLLAPDFTIVGVTDAYLRATMTRRGEILGRGLFEVFPDNPDDPAADGVRNLRASLQRVVAERKPDRMALQKYDIRRPQAEGGGFEERYWSPLNTPVLDQDGALRYIIHWVEDVTEVVRLKEEMRREQALMNEELGVRASRIEAESYLRIEAVEANQRLTESERRYRFLADAVPQLIWTADPNGLVDYCNARWLGFTDLGFEQLRGTGWERSLHPDEVERLRSSWAEAVRAGVDRFQLEHRLRYRDGTWRWMLTTALPFRDASGAVEKWFGSTTDIHEQVTAREQLLQAQRLQAVGKLAGGMAHEVNNMMTVVLGIGDLVRSELDPEHPQRPDLDEMLKAATRAVEVTRQLLAFSRQQVLKPVVLDVNLVVSELGPALEQLVGSNRRLEIVSAVPVLRTRADRTQVEQVLINLVANARDATTTDGVIVVRTDRVQVDETELRASRESEAEPGVFVRLVVVDNGAGMSPDTLARAFEPFFTTKVVGQGTGLGLSMVYGIVRQSGGFLRIDSTPDAGTMVAVHLPLVDAEPSLPEALREVPRGRGETVLVVEDESVVRSLTSRVLQAAGYKIYQAPNGAVALEFLRAHPDEVDLVLTDIVMPRMTGHELEASIREQWPGLPVLFMSGYVGGQSVEGESTVAGVPLIKKPFTPRALEAAVRERLDLVWRGLRTP
jgi:PAS domain S-box-containing protein